MSKVIFRFNPAVASKELIQSFNHQVYDLKGDGEFTASDADWLSLSKVQVSQYEGEGEARKLVEIPAFELVKQEEAAEPEAAEQPGRARTRRA